MFPFTSFAFRKYTDGNISYWYEPFDKAYLITVFEATETLNQSKWSWSCRTGTPKYPILIEFNLTGEYYTIYSPNNDIFSSLQPSNSLCYDVTYLSDG